MHLLILPNLLLLRLPIDTIRLVFSFYPTCLDIIQQTNAAFRDEGVGQNNGSWGLEITVLSIKL